MSDITFLEVPVWDTGLVLVLLSNGMLTVERSVTFVPLYDLAPNKHGVDGLFDLDSFRLTDHYSGMQCELDYGTMYAYQAVPLLKAWLIQQKLEIKE
jgi:hypothetical protein